MGEPTILVMLTDLSQDNRAAYDRSNGEDRAMSILGELAAVELEKATAALRTLLSLIHI